MRGSRQRPADGHGDKVADEQVDREGRRPEDLVEDQAARAVDGVVEDEEVLAPNELERGHLRRLQC